MKNARCLATPVSAMDVVTVVIVVIVMVTGAMMTVVIMTIVVHVFADNVVDEIRDLIDAAEEQGDTRNETNARDRGNRHACQWDQEACHAPSFRDSVRSGVKPLRHC